MSFTDTILNPILNPLLELGTFWTIFIIALAFSLVSTLASKYLTNQERIKQIKTQSKEYQAKIKESKDQPDVVMQIQKEMMQHQMELFKSSLKPTLFTFIPIILVLGWMSAHLLYEPIQPGDQFGLTASFQEGITGIATLSAPRSFTILNPTNQTITNGQAHWQLRANQTGSYLIDVDLLGTTASKEVLITTENNYAEQNKKIEGPINSLSIIYQPLKPLDVSIFGWKPGWLGWYIILSLIFSISLRKLLKVH